MTNKKLSDLKSADYNPRTISEKALSGLKYSIDEFGDISGFVFNRRTGNLVAAHQRKSALELSDGDYDIEIIDQYDTPSDKGTVAYGFVDFNGERFNYREVDWDLSKEKAANIAANSPTIQGEFTSGVALVLEDINLTDSSLFSALAFNELDIPDLEVSIEEDDFDVEKELEAIVEPRTKPGDLYQLGVHRLLCGDSTKREDVERVMNSEQARLIFTDPPYNVDYKSPSSLSYDSTKFGGTGGKMFNDNKSDIECLEFYSDVLRNLHEFSTDDVTLFWWFANKNHTINRQAFENTKWYFSQVVIWVKNSFVFSRGQNFHRMYEPCMVGWKKGKKHYKNKELSNLADVYNLDYDDFIDQFDLWYEKRDVTNQYLHPTQKPVRLAERALRRNSQVNDLVVDLFGGSGSTMIACEQLERKCNLIELDPKFCDVIVKRLMKFKNVSKVILNGEEIEF
ncbi:MAG: hypothetical protein KKB34_04980 [Bacteroidetes bacterium]|nr:hypothetical protein [Bacteroidota bacterium]